MTTPYMQYIDTNAYQAEKSYQPADGSSKPCQRPSD